MKKKKKKTRIK